eukprot:gene6681-9165_t
MTSTLSQFPSKTKLALNVIDQHFGNQVKIVAKTITETENASLLHIMRTVKGISSAQVREAMTVLHLHNCLRAEIPFKDISMDAMANTNSIKNESDPNVDKNKQVGLIYSLDIDMILNRLRFSILLKIVKDKFGEIGVRIMEEVIFHGRLTKSFILDSMTISSDVMDDTTNDNYNKKEKIHAVFNLLVRNRFLITISPLDIRRGTDMNANKKSNKKSQSIPPIHSRAALDKNVSQSIEPTVANPMKRKRVTKPPPKSDDVQHELPMELRMIIEQQTSMENKSDEVGGDAEWDDNLSNSQPNSKKARANTTGGGRGSVYGRHTGRLAGRGGRQGRVSGSSGSSMLPSVDLDDDTDGNIAENSNKVKLPQVSSQSNPAVAETNVYWAIGWDQFYREQRHSCCIALASDRMEQLAGNVVRIILQNSMNTEIGFAQNKSSAMTISSILEGLHKIQYASNVARTAPATLKKLMDLLCADSVGAIIKVVGSDQVEGGPSYMVNYESIITHVRSKTIHDICVNRYGQASGRIIELLSRVKYVEQQKISDSVILPTKEARERLYGLYRDKWINYVELSKRNDFNPATNYYFWYLDPSKLKITILEHLFTTVTNLRLRYAHEIESSQNVIEMSAGVMSRNTGSSETAGSMVVGNGSSYEQLLIKINRIEHAISELDKTVMIMEWF